MTVRPAESKRRLRLTAEPLVLARLAAGAARCRVPVDVAAWISLELIPRGGTEPAVLWSAAARLSRASPCPDPALSRWLDQLRHGAPFFEDELPYVWVPERLASRAAAESLNDELTCAAADPWLCAALDLECAAARSGLTAGAALDAESARQEQVGTRVDRALEAVDDR